MNAISFAIPIAPKASNKRHAFVIGGQARVVQDKGVVQHQAQIATLAAAHRPDAPLDEPVEVQIVCVLPRPQGLCKLSARTGLPLVPPGRRRHTSKPDCDNLAKSVLDGLKSWWRDDCVVQVLHVEKWTAALGEQPHYQVTVRSPDGGL